VAAVIGLALGLRALSDWDGQLIPEVPSDPVTATTAVDETGPLSDAGTARIRGVDFAVVEHEMTSCVTLASGEERCAPGGQAYLLVKMSVENSERYPTTDGGPDIRVVYQGQLLPKMVFLPQGKPPRSACTPEGYYEDTLCHFWLGAVAPEGARVAELEVRAEEDGTVYVWSLGSPGEVRVSRPGPLVWPTTRREISGWAFRDPRNPDHPGIDIAADEGDPIVAAAEGKVIFAGWAGDYGNLVVVEHADGWSSFYGQLSEVLVEVDAELEQGELLGRAGSTGDSSGPHLHFELRYAGVAVDPLDYLPSRVPLEALLLGPDDLPGTVLESGGLDGWVVRPMEREGEPDGEDWIDDLAKADGCIEALRIQGPREVATIDGSIRVVYVMNTAYRFATVEQAQREHDAVVRRATSDAREQLYASAPSPAMETHTFALTGESDDVIYWLVGMRKQDVLLLMVNGLDDAGTREVFDAAVSQFLEMDHTRNVPDQKEQLAALFVQDPAAACGWEVLGERDGETYVWAICQSPRGRAVSAPAVLFWSSGDVGERRLLDVRMPRDGTYYGEDVRRLFPTEVQDRIFYQNIDMDGIWEQLEGDLFTVTGTVVDNAASAQVVTLEDANGEQWHFPWRASGGVHGPDGSAARFRDIERGMRIEVVGFKGVEAATPNVVSAVRVTIVDDAGLAPGVDAVIDCAAVYPGAAGCLQQQPLVGGRLAFVDERAPFDGRPVMLDLEQGGAPVLGDDPDELRGWSPSGAYLRTGRGVYDTDGRLVLWLEGPGGSMPAFWAPAGAFGDDRDWLLQQTGDGGLKADAMPESEVRELLPPGTLGPDGRDAVLVSDDGQLAWTPGMDRLAEAGEWAQELHVRPVDGSGGGRHHSGPSRNRNGSTLP
ncbi:MAG: M23 family metallopeptidase, partial [Chloroflexota bacterium]